MLGLRGLRAAAQLGSATRTHVRFNTTDTSAASDVISKFASRTSAHSKLKTPRLEAFTKRESRDIMHERELKTEPKQFAKLIPITGPIAGRMVMVSPGSIDSGFKSLKNLVNANNIRTEKNAQRFYKKPSKVIEEKRMRRKKKLFDTGIRRLIDIVKDANRRGY